MTDVHDVITKLETLKDEIRTGRVKSASASYAVRRMDWIGDAIAILKAQEPIPPHDYDPVIYGHRYTCGNCHHSLWRNDNYCSQCGKEVKWE